MYSWMLFIHLAGLAAWFGVTLLGAIMLSSFKGKIAEAGISSVALSTVKNINRVTHLSAFLVLASGLYMILQWDREGMPFWLAFMERAGGMIVLLFIIILSIFGGRLKRTLAKGDAAGSAKGIAVYTTLAFVFLLAILAVILVVSLRM